MIVDLCNVRQHFTSILCLGCFRIVKPDDESRILRQQLYVFTSSLGTFEMTLQQPLDCILNHAGPGNSHPNFTLVFITYMTQLLQLKIYIYLPPYSFNVLTSTCTDTLSTNPNQTLSSAKLRKKYVQTRPASERIAQRILSRFTICLRVERAKAEHSVQMIGSSTLLNLSRSYVHSALFSGITNQRSSDSLLTMISRGLISGYTHCRVLWNKSA